MPTKKTFEVGQMVVYEDPDWIPTDMLDAALVPAMARHMPARVTRVAHNERSGHQDVFLDIPGYATVPCNANYLRVA